jgi:hypothetical protein
MPMPHRILGIHLHILPDKKYMRNFCIISIRLNLLVLKAEKKEIQQFRVFNDNPSVHCEDFPWTNEL